MSIFKHLSNWVSFLGKVIQPFFLLIIRVLWGLGFFFAGTGKLMHIDKTIEFFNSIHLSYPVFNAYLVGLVEAIGGVLLILGLGARLATIPLIIVMLVALGTVHKDAVLGIYQAFDVFSTQAPIPFLLTLLTVLCFGPGLFSLDALCCKFCCDKNKDKS